MAVVRTVRGRLRALTCDLQPTGTRTRLRLEWHCRVNFQVFCSQSLSKWCIFAYSSMCPQSSHTLVETVPLNRDPNYWLLTECAANLHLKLELSRIYSCY